MEDKNKNTDSDNPLVSVIVITYNSSKYVLETLESAKAQTYQNIELIISDDASTDDTVEVCRKWVEENKGRFVRTEIITTPKNTGIPANCNRGVKAAKGEWVKLIAGDDALTIDCIQIYVNYTKEHPDSLVLYSNILQYKNSFEENNKQVFFQTGKLKISHPKITANEQFEILLRANKVWAASLFISNKVYEKVGFYDESVKLWEDRPMLLKITNNNIKLHFMNFISCKYRVHSNSVQRSRKKKNLITPFQIEKDLYFLNNYLKYLPYFERLIKNILIQRRLILVKLRLNNNDLITKGFLIVTSFPWSCFEKMINKKYL